MKNSERLFVFNLLLFITMPPLVMASSIGTHCWEQAPFAQIICFDVNNVNKRYFSLIGENIANEATYPVDGSALLDMNNNVFRISFTQNLGQNFVFENAVTINPATLSGTWSDDGGNSGDFKYLGVAPLDPEKMKSITTRKISRMRRKK
jgi:hypothetical protein